MSVETYANEYIYSHQRAPRGFGSWAFKLQGQAEFFWVHQSTYGDAKKTAVAHAKTVGARFVSVQP